MQSRPGYRGRKDLADPECAMPSMARDGMRADLEASSEAVIVIAAEHFCFS